MTGRLGLRALAAGLALAATVFSAAAQEAGLGGRARLDSAGSSLAASGDGAVLDLRLSQAVPWRVRLLDAPPRVALDFREVDWQGLDPAILGTAAAVAGLRAGQRGDGWSRLVLDLARPQRVAEAGMTVDAGSGRARVVVRLSPVDEATFADLTDTESRPSAFAALRPEPAAGRLRVVIDPGHGGVDPGAERDGLREADLMLTFARELEEMLLRAGGFEVALTREADSFVSLDSRVRIAHEAGADVFLSLHADALGEGRASGATVYTLAEEATDAAAAALAARHDRDDLLAGVDLRGQDDAVARALMGLARTATTPRSDALADTLVETIRASTGNMHPRPRQAAAFSVLKAPDIPSVLVELGFLSDAQDRANLTDPQWRSRMARGILEGLRRWSDADEAAAALRMR